MVKNLSDLFVLISHIRRWGSQEGHTEEGGEVIGPLSYWPTKLLCIHYYNLNSQPITCYDTSYKH